MVFPARCPALKCRKFILVEESDRGKLVVCLLCKTPIRVPLTDGPQPQTTPANPLPVARLLPPSPPNNPPRV